MFLVNTSVRGGEGRGDGEAGGGGQEEPGCPHPVSARRLRAGDWCRQGRPPRRRIQPLRATVSPGMLRCRAGKLARQIRSTAAAGLLAQKRANVDEPDQFDFSLQKAVVW